MAISTLDLPKITAGTISVTNGSRLVNLAGAATAWDSGNNPLVGAGAWLSVAGASMLVGRLVSPTQLELELNWTGSTASGLSYVLTLPRGSTDVLTSGVIQSAVNRYEITFPEDDIALEAGGQRHRLLAQSDGTLVIRSGSTGTAWSSLPVIETLTAMATRYGPRPQAAAGVGQVVTVIPAANVALTLPAGGSWFYLAILGNTSSGAMLTGQIYTGIGAGGATVLGAQGAGFQWNCLAWRIG